MKPFNIIRKTLYWVAGLMGRHPILQSILDTDLYKLTMMQIVYALHKDKHVVYKFKNRGGTTFPKGFSDELRLMVVLMKNLRLNSFEKTWLKENCPYFKNEFLGLLESYRFGPDEVLITEPNPGEVEITISGPWWRTILWEVPLMAIISELYFYMTEQDADKSLMLKNLTNKAWIFAQHGCQVAEFGTRRRYSFKTQEEVIQLTKLSPSVPNFIIGTSNVHLAMKHGLKPIGTMAHEWFMGYQGWVNDLVEINRRALRDWHQFYDGQLSIALTDTYTTDVFFHAFDENLARLYDGVRQDSGDPIEFGKKMIAHYKKLRINPQNKTIVFSDGLDAETATQIQEIFEDQINVLFGIGTYLSNDVGVKPLNMVIKLWESNGVPVIKLSDTAGKHNGEPEAVQAALDQVEAL